MTTVKATITVKLKVPKGEERAAAWLLRDVLERELDDWDKSLMETFRQLRDEVRREPDHPLSVVVVKPMGYSVPLAKGRRVDFTGD